MAMLFKSTFLLVATFVFVADALLLNKPGCDGDNKSHGTGHSGATATVGATATAGAAAGAAAGTTGVGIVPIKIGGLNSGNKPSAFSKLGIDLDDEKCADKYLEKIDNFKFDKEKFRAFLHKIKNLFQVYASKELVPEIKEMIAKTFTFIIETIVKQKPEEMARINKVIQKSAKICEDACNKENDAKDKGKGKC